MPPAPPDEARAALDAAGLLPDAELDITEAQFQELAGAAKAGCPVSKVLNAEITLAATLAG